MLKLQEKQRIFLEKYFLSSVSELILAQEQGVINRLGVGKQVTGTLVLTNKRVLFVAANAEEDFGITSKALRYADIEDLKSIKPDPSNLAIALESVEEVKSSSGLVRTPSLKIKYDTENKKVTAEFEQTIIGGRKKNLNDWAPVIEDLKSGKRKISVPSGIPGRDSLEGKIYHVLGDLQEKGPFEIERQVEKEFKIDLDPDEVQSACDKLVSMGLTEECGSNVLAAYRRISPLGKDDLSS